MSPMPCCSMTNSYHDPLCPTRTGRPQHTPPVSSFDDPLTDSAGRIIITLADSTAPPIAPNAQHAFTSRMPLTWDAVKDSGRREEFEGGSRRDTQEGKPRYDLLNPLGLERVAIHAANGAEKYGEFNWALGQPTRRILASAFRHLMALFFKRTDEDHAAALAWNALAFMQFEGTEWDDRFDWTVPPRPETPPTPTA